MTEKNEKAKGLKDNEVGQSGVDGMVRWRDSPFGEYACLDIPNDADMILVSIDLMQHEPETILLPSQLYRKRLKKLLEENPGIRSFTVHPLRSKERITIEPEAI